MKNTKNKNEILTFLMQHRDAYTPYEIAKSLKINAVTVYRVLESLKKEKVVHHIISLGKWSACQCHDIRKDH
jgi:Fe2+ or Zn2+ uptake regulation protein